MKCLRSKSLNLYSIAIDFKIVPLIESIYRLHVTLCSKCKLSKPLKHKCKPNPTLGGNYYLFGVIIG